MGAKMGGMLGGGGGGGEDDFARRRMMAILGANMMGSPHPGAIGQGLQQGTLGAIDARREWQERQRQRALDEQRAEDRQWQMGQRQWALEDRAGEESAMQAERRRIAEARARLREAGDANADFYSAKQVDEQYSKRFGFQEPDEGKWVIREGGDGRQYRVNPVTGETEPLDIPAETGEAEEVNWQTQVGGDGKTYQVHPRTGAVRPIGGIPPKPAQQGGMSEAEKRRIADQSAKRTYDEEMDKFKRRLRPTAPIWANHYNREASRLGLPLLPGDTYQFPSEVRSRQSAGLSGGSYEFDSSGNLVRRD